MDVVVAELAIIRLAAENVGLAVDHGDCVVGPSEGEPVSRSASAEDLIKTQGQLTSCPSLELKQSGSGQPQEAV